MEGRVLGALVAGLIVGAIPAITGAVKGKIAYAIGGFFACLVASILLGLILSVPVCAVFLYFIFKESNENNNPMDDSSNSNMN